MQLWTAQQGNQGYASGERRAAAAAQQIIDGICRGGAGTLQPIDKSTRAVAKFADCAEYSCAYDTQYKDFLPLIEEKTI